MQGIYWEGLSILRGRRGRAFGREGFELHAVVTEATGNSRGNSEFEMVLLEARRLDIETSILTDHYKQVTLGEERGIQVSILSLAKENTWIWAQSAA